MVPSTLGLVSVLLLTTALQSPKLAVPNFADLTIKISRTVGDHYSNVETLYLKGARQRSEHVMQNAGNSGMNGAEITQCDEKVRISLHPREKTYVSFPIEDWATRIKRTRPIPPAEMTGADVVVTIDSVDTGERRKMGSHELRRVKTTTKVEPSAGAVMPASLTEVDGWYIDLPGLGCQESRGAGFSYGTTSNKRDRLQIKRLGTAPRGYAVEETSCKTEAGRTTVSKVELLEFSESPLDASLFELPAGYSPALRTPRGGFDMTKPDTLGNRLQSYWAEMTTSVQRWFR